MKNHDKALDWLEIGVESLVPGILYITHGTTKDLLKDNPMYLELLKKMNLPLPLEKFMRIFNHIQSYN